MLKVVLMVKGKPHVRVDLPEVPRKGDGVFLDEDYLIVRDVTWIVSTEGGQLSAHLELVPIGGET